MTEAELRAIAAGGESEQVEFKRSTGRRSDAARTACAMMNGQGGFVLFGVADEGDVVGQDVTARTIASVVGELRRIEPPALLSPEEVSLETGRAAIILRVPGTEHGTYTIDGRPYMRQGPTTVVMPQEEYRRRLLEQTHPAHRWENLTAEVAIDELDHSEITRTIDEGIRRQRLDEPGTRDPEALLRGLRLMRADRVLNAAVVLFGRRDTMGPEYSQCLLRMARFRGSDKTEFQDNRQESGNIFLLFQAAQRFLRDHLPVAGRVLPGVFEREDDPLFPPSALREALANAFCHRDYRIPGGSVSIGIFDDRLEITSTGTLPPGLTPAHLLLPHASRPRNPTIAGALYRRGIIEQWGRGTIKIAELTQQAGLARPEFEDRGGEVVVRFFPEGYVPPPRAEHELTQRQQEILILLGELGPVPSSVVRPRLTEPASENALFQDLKLLRHLGLVRKTGRTRDAKWHLTGRPG